MNNYPSWWDTTITLYNKYIDPITKNITWYSHIIENCFYKHTVDKMTVNNTTIESNVSICRLRVNDSFINKREWNELTSEEKKQMFTLGAGDIIVAGEVDFIVDEYEKGHYSSDLIREFSSWPGCFTIETVNINVGGGRGNEHYHVRGT